MFLIGCVNCTSGQPLHLLVKEADVMPVGVRARVAPDHPPHELRVPPDLVADPLARAGLPLADVVRVKLFVVLGHETPDDIDNGEV